MDGISHYENMLAEAYEKIRARQRLTLDEKIDFYLAKNRINIMKYGAESDPRKKEHYRKQAEIALQRARKLEKTLGIDIQFFYTIKNIQSIK